MKNLIKQKRIHIFGASGSGATTLGANIAQVMNLKHLDADNYIWIAKIPPFGEIRGSLERNTLLDRDIRTHNSWVLAGLICGWGDFAIRYFDIVIFLLVPKEERMKRYTSRYTKKFGNEILDSGHPLHKRFKAFKTWASSYD